DRAKFCGFYVDPAAHDRRTEFTVVFEPKGVDTIDGAVRNQRFALVRDANFLSVAPLFISTRFFIVTAGGGDAKNNADTKNTNPSTYAHNVISSREVRTVVHANHPSVLRTTM